MKQRFIRHGDDLDDGNEVVVRGGELDPDVLRQDALRNHRVYGVYAISVLAVRDVSLDEMIQQPPLIRFERLTLTTAGNVRAVGLRLEPTGHSLRHYDVVFDDLEDGIRRLSNCEHRVVVNPYHEA